MNNPPADRTEYQRRWRQEHQEHLKASKRAYYEAHKEECIANTKTYILGHQEQRAATCKRYRQNHREQQTIAQQRRREAQRQPLRTITCLNCGQTFETRALNKQYCGQSCQTTFNNRNRVLPPNVSYDCAVCGKHVEKYVSPAAWDKNTFQYCSRQCKGTALSGQKHPMWQGGLTTDKAHQKELQHAGYLRHMDTIKEKVRQYRQSHPEQERARSRKREALERGAGSASLTAGQWTFLKDIYDHRCVYCGRQRHELTQDHIVPLSKGGEHVLENVVPACRSCNSRKHTGPPLVPVQIAMRLV